MNDSSCALSLFVEEWYFDHSVFRLVVTSAGKCRMKTRHFSQMLRGSGALTRHLRAAGVLQRIGSATISSTTRTNGGKNIVITSLRKPGK